MNPMADEPHRIAYQTLRGLVADDILGEAAKVAFFMILSLFPLLVLTLSVAGMVGGQAAYELILGAVHGMIPQEGAAFIAQYVEEVAFERAPEGLSVGFAVTLFLASLVFFRLAEALNVVYGLPRRSWFSRRVVAMIVLLLGTLVLLTGATIILMLPELTGFVGVGPMWVLFRWPVALVLQVVVLALVFRMLPNRGGSAHWPGIIIGATVGGVLGSLATLGFRFYLTRFAELDAMYGAFGGPVVLILWLYLLTLALLFAAKLAAVLEMHGGAHVFPVTGRPLSGG